MFVTDYTTKIKEICDALGSINVTVHEDEMVEIVLGGLAQRYGSIRTTICAREKPPSFFVLQSMLMVEENHVSGLRTTQSDSRMLYTEVDRPHGHGGHGDRHAMVVIDKSRKEGIEEMPIEVPDPPQAGGVTVEPEIGKQRPKRNASIVARTATRKASARKSASIRRKPDAD